MACAILFLPSFSWLNQRFLTRLEYVLALRVHLSTKSCYSLANPGRFLTSSTIRRHTQTRYNSLTHCQLLAFICSTIGSLSTNPPTERTNLLRKIIWSVEGSVISTTIWVHSFSERSIPSKNTSFVLGRTPTLIVYAFFMLESSTIVHFFMDCIQEWIFFSEKNYRIRRNWWKLGQITSVNQKCYASQLSSLNEHPNHPRLAQRFDSD